MKKVLLLISLIVTGNYFSSSAQSVKWKDVAPIFYNNCATCHRPGEIGDGKIYANSYNALLSDPFGYFSAIPGQVSSDNGSAPKMPPWKADPAYHHFLDERVLSQAEIDLVDTFVAQIYSGVFDGDTTLAPPNPVFPTGSQLGIPDTTLTMTSPFTIPGDNIDHYQVFVLHTNITDSAGRTVKAVEFRPGNPRLVHHIFIYTCIDGSADSLDATTPEYGYPSFGGAGEGVNADFLTLYGPGLTPRFYPEGSGIKFKVNTSILLQVHYAPTSTPQTDQSSINIFYDSLPNVRQVKGKRVGENYVLEPVFFIVKNKVLTFHSAYTLDTTYSMFSIAPHMHLLGKEFKIYAVTPSNDTVPLVHIPAWDFKWQLLYNFPCYVILPQGTVIYSEATYDNTTNNPNNPNNPPQNVGYGESSYDEMDKYFMNLLTYKPGDEFVVFDSALCALDDYDFTGLPPTAGIVSTPQLYDLIPNPANARVTLDYYLPNSTNSKIYVYDLMGRRVGPMLEQTSIPGLHHSELNVESFVPGMYLVVLEADGKHVTKELVVQH